jgi:NADH-quinone oxidoreductase subunit F
MATPAPERTSAARDAVLRLAASGLRGRGGSWFPTARKWRAVLAEGGAPALVANGAEGEPGSIKDRFLMRRHPSDVLAGVARAAALLGVPDPVVYLKGGFLREESSLRAALPPGASIAIRRGADTYVAGEETAVLEALEDRRAWPRPKPPLPAAVGLYGRPTLVQNVETLWRLPAALDDPDAYAAGETTLVSLWGHVRRPGVYDVRLGTPLARVIEEHGGGATDGIGMLFPAGPSAAPLAPAQAETPLDPDALRAAGSALGTAALLVIGRTPCPLAVGASLASFFERESCGQCPPCTVGTGSLARVLRAVEAGTARPRDLQNLAEAAGFMAGHGYCAHARTAAGVVQGLLARFRDDVAAHLAAGRCPREGGDSDPFAPDSRERAVSERMLDEATA